MLFALSVLEKQQGENIEIMKNTKSVEHIAVAADEMRDEYQFDYKCLDKINSIILSEMLNHFFNICHQMIET